MKQMLKTMFRRAGVDIQLVKPPFVPYVHKYQFGDFAFDFWIANRDAVWWYKEEAWKASGELKELARLAKSGDRVLEIGSHHGFTGLLFAGYVGPKGLVVGLEAHPWNAMIDTAQLGLNPGIKNLRFINAAGSDKEGVLKMVSENHNSSVGVGGAGTTTEVPARTGDALDQELGPFDLLKIDVEGFETQVLKGCKNLLRRRPKLAVELHLDEMPKYGTNAAEVLELINVKDYEGTMVMRPDTSTIRSFVPDQMPEHGIVNLFLTPRQGAPS
jgi:FkbM family methyltransferase